MPAPTFFHSWAATMAKTANVATDQFTVFLTNTNPTVASDDELADITSPVTSNLSSLNLTTTSTNQSGGTLAIVLAQLVITASGAAGPFRYYGVYDNTLSGDPLVCLDVNP